MAMVVTSLSIGMAAFFVEATAVRERLGGKRQSCKKDDVCRSHTAPCAPSRLNYAVPRD